MARGATAKQCRDGAHTHEFGGGRFSSRRDRVWVGLHVDLLSLDSGELHTQLCLQALFSGKLLSPHK